MRNIFYSIVVCFAVGVSFADTFDKAWLKGTTNKNPLSYKVGEEMVITVTPMEIAGKVPSGCKLWYLRSGDDGVRDEKTIPFTGKPFVYKTKIDKPGFVRLQMQVVDATGHPVKRRYLGDTSTPEGKKAANDFERNNPKVFFDGGAGAEIEKLTTEPEPADFDKFWAEQFKRLDLIPIEAKRKEIKIGRQGVKVYAVMVDCAGLRPVSGYLSIPVAAETGIKYPCWLETHGYNGKLFNHDGPWGTPTDAIVFNINAHGLKLKEFGGTEADRKALCWECESHDCIYGFDPKQNADPEVAYFNGMVLRVKRALQYLKTLPEWNGKDLEAVGGSQGGLQTVWAAGCGEGVTKAMPHVTWCCDMYTTGKLRNDRSLGLASDAWYIEWTPALGYYDAANWSKRIPRSCFVDVTRAGLGDYCCPPRGLAVAWNYMTCPKKIRWVQGSQHGYVPPEYAKRDFIFEKK